MKKRILIVLSCLLALSLLAGCARPTGGAPVLPVEDSASEAAPEKPLRIVTTIFPVYDWLMNLLGEQQAKAELTLLLDNGVDLHSYQPTAEDIVRISNCDLFVYVGGESDAWVEGALREAVNPDMVIVNLLEALGDAARPEEIAEGMEAHDHDHDHDHEEEYDEHIWLSLKNAGRLCAVLRDSLCGLDPAGAAAYRENAAAYLEKLSALDAAYQAAVDKAPQRTLLFGDRFPFRYLTEDYGLDYYAAFSGCSAETEASFETIVFLADKLDELGLRAILQLESADGSIARTIRENTAAKDQEILTLDSLQSATSRDRLSGTSYLSVMENNLRVLEQALES